MNKFFKMLSFLVVCAMIFGMQSCNKDDEPDAPDTPDTPKPEVVKLTKTVYTMHHDETQRVEGNGISGIEWDSENDYVARMDGDVIKGMYVGKTTVRASSGKYSFTVEITPRYELFDEPCMEWGLSKSDIKKKFGKPNQESDKVLLYGSTNPKVSAVGYVFDDNGRLSGCAVLCYTLRLDPTDFAGFLAERYVSLGSDKQDMSYTFAHCYGKADKPQVDYGVLVDLDFRSDIIYVGYTSVKDATKSDSQGIDRHAMETIRQAISELK